MLNMRIALLRKRHEKLAGSHQEAKYRFILTELDLAITFCDVALGSSDRARYERNTVNARQAYKAATHFLEDSHFSEQMKAQVKEKVDRLRIRLRQIGRHGRTLAARKALAAN